MTDKQRQMARHALGLPNKRHVTNRDYYCIGEGGDGYAEWMSMVAEGYAVKRQHSSAFGGDDIFYLTMIGVRLALEPHEHISRDDAALMRSLEAAK